MIEVMRDLPDHVVGFTAHGRVTSSDYDSVLTPELDARFRSHAKLSLLYHFAEDFSGFEEKAIWDDTWADLHHFRAWEKIAVVTDIGWIHRLAKLFGLLRPGRARVFTNAQLGEARNWVRA
ncbi:MAG: STAS/SEC14 domain-containing protein, partial [Polyangiales bacterium]